MSFFPSEKLIYNNVFRKLSNAYGERHPLGTRTSCMKEKQYSGPSSCPVGDCTFPSF